MRIRFQEKTGPINRRVVCLRRMLVKNVIICNRRSIIFMLSFIGCAWLFEHIGRT